MKKFLILFLLLATPCFASDEVKIQVRFKEAITVQGRGNPVEFSDCLYYTPEEWANLQPSELQAKKKERTDNWKHMLEAPQPVIEPTKADLEQQLAQIEEQKASLENQKAEISGKLSALAVGKVTSEIRDE